LTQGLFDLTRPRRLRPRHNLPAASPLSALVGKRCTGISTLILKRSGIA
jgi:hypothetical protein